MMALSIMAAFAVWQRSTLRHGIVAFLTVHAPAAGVALVGGQWLWRRYQPTPPPDVGRVARLVGLALRSGMPLPSALRHAASEVGVTERAAITDLLRRSAAIGLGPALASTTGVLGPMARRLAAAHHTGAPLAAAVEALERELAELHRAAVLSRVRRLPVQLTLPLVLLILPGSILLLVGPRVLDELARLTAPFEGLAP